MAHQITEKRKAELRQRMLSGEPFTYGRLCRQFFPGAAMEDGSRVVDRMIQSLRRAGLIAFTRMRSETLWAATPAGLEAKTEIAA